jgi:hypothetical protein
MSKKKIKIDIRRLQKNCDFLKYKSALNNKLNPEILMEISDRNVKILNLISIIDVFILKSFFIANRNQKEQNYNLNIEEKNIEKREELIIKIKVFIKMVNERSFNSSSLKYPLDIFGTKHFLNFFQIQNITIQENFINYFNDSLRSLQIDANKFVKIVKEIKNFRGKLVHRKEIKIKEATISLSYICELLPTKYSSEIKALFSECKITLQAKEYIQTIIKIKKNKPKKFIGYLRDHTIVEKENFVGVDNISRIKEIMKSIDFHSIDPNFFKKNFDEKNQKNFVKNMKFEEIEAIFFAFIQINYIFKKYFIKIYETFYFEQSKYRFEESEKEFFNKLNQLLNDSKIKNLRNNIAHSHLILGEKINEEIVEIMDEKNKKSLKKNLNFTINYYQEIFELMLNFFDNLYKILQENNFDQKILNEIYQTKKSFLQSLFSMLCKVDHFLEFDSKNYNKPVDKRINKNEFAKIDKNKNLIENGILKFHFYAIFKTAFRKILEDEKNKNYESPTCIKIKKN